MGKQGVFMGQSLVTCAADGYYTVSKVQISHLILISIRVAIKVELESHGHPHTVQDLPL